MRTLRTFTSLAVAFGTLVALSGSASAQEKGMGAFGEKGRIILSADRLMTLFSYVSVSRTDEVQTGPNQTVTTEVKTSGPALSLLMGGNIPRENVHTIPRVSLDYTVIPQLTVGGSIAVAFGLGGKEETKAGNVTTSVDAPSTTVFGFAPRVGYILDLNDSFAFWPRGGFGVYFVSATSDRLNNNATVTTTDTTSFFSLDLDPQFVFTPFPHFGINAGPLVNIPLLGSVKHTTETGGTTTTRTTDSKTFQLGITAGILGWF